MRTLRRYRCDIYGSNDRNLISHYEYALNGMDAAEQTMNWHGEYCRVNAYLDD